MSGGFSMKRQRGRGRKPGGGGGSGGGGGGGHHQPNRTLESNGPDMKVRGPASHIYERYLQLARDASSAGDRVMAENYLQHAEHYFRMLRAMQPAAPPPNVNERFGSDADYDGDEDEAMDGGEGEQPQAASGEQSEGDFSQQGGQDLDRDGFRRRRGRRNRFRPDGERDDQAGGEGGERTAHESGDRQSSKFAPNGLSVSRALSVVSNAANGQSGQSVSHGRSGNRVRNGRSGSVVSAGLAQLKLKAMAAARRKGFRRAPDQLF